MSESTMLAIPDLMTTIRLLELLVAGRGAVALATALCPNSDDKRLVSGAGGPWGACRGH